MACVENIAPMEVDSEMEEGEIVDELSDISSEEEYLLRERLAVLENYNNVLERKKAKRTSVGPGTTPKKDVTASYELSEISATEFEEYCSPHKIGKPPRHQKSLSVIKHHRQRRKKGDFNNTFEKSRDHKKRNSHSKKRLEVKVIRESSEESEDDYKNSRKKLADAVIVNKPKNDKTTLSERLQKMLCGVNPEPIKFIVKEKEINANINIESESTAKPPSLQNNNILNSNAYNAIQDTKTNCEIIDISTDEDNKAVVTITSVDTVDSVLNSSEHKENIQKNLDDIKELDKDSDDDLETLRQHALKTKIINTDNDIELLRQQALNTKTVNSKNPQDVPHNGENKNVSEDEDSDTTELRLICLKSALIKKAIEMKRKQKLRKRLSQSQSCNNNNESLEHIVLAERINSDNNTDIESVDMDMGSDADDKVKENGEEYANNNSNEFVLAATEKHIPVLMVKKDDELDEDEDLLRAKLLTSLSKKLPNLVDPSIIKDKSVMDTKCVASKPSQPNTVPEEKRFIIRVESDSEGENEATRNLTKMHMKLSDQKDFQQKLDVFLKSTRMEVENTTLPDIVQPPIVPAPKKNEKFVAKAVKNLPKSEQLEYKYLVKRMSELEKLKQARQSTMNLTKDTIKPKNTTINTSQLFAINNLEEKINLSRKNIAEESAKMLKLKEEGVKLSQKFKIVATELRNIKTALALNKKQQRSVQIYLSKIRQHHHMLLRSSLTSTHSKVTVQQLNNLDTIIQKNNKPKENKNLVMETSKENPRISVQKNIKVDITKDQKQPDNSVSTAKPGVIQHPRLSVEIDVTTNKKVITLSNKDDSNEKIVVNENETFNNKEYSSNPVVEKGGGMDTKNVVSANKIRRNSDDYKSPLDAFGSNTWREDPNAILCPFEVCGDCKDVDCKFLHTNNPSK